MLNMLVINPRVVIFVGMRRKIKQEIARLMTLIESEPNKEERDEMKLFELRVRLMQTERILKLL